MSHAWQQVDMIAQESLIHLEDSLTISSLTTVDKTADFLVRPNGYAIGDTVRIKTRPQYEAKEFSTETVNQDIRESTRNMAIEKHFDVTVPITAKEKVLDLDSLVDQVIKPAAYALAEKCDRYVGGKILNGRGLYASAALYGGAADMALARKAATLQQLNAGGRYNLLNLDLEALLLGADWFGTWNERGPDGAANRREGSMGRTMGMDFFSSINFPETDTGVTFTPGTGVAVTKTSPSGVENNVGQVVLTFNAAATGTFKAGDRLKIAGVRRPVIVKTGGATPTSVTLEHPIDEPIPVTAAVTTISNNAEYVVQGAIFDDSSIGLAMPLLDPPSDKPSSSVSNNGYSLRVVQGYDMKTKTETISLDMLIGAEAYDGRRITLLADQT